MIPLIVPLSAGAWAFWITAPLMVLGALGLVSSKKPVHSALWMAVVMIGLAAQFASLDAPFLFVVQIIVYTGAILMLFLFVVMVVGVDVTESFVETIKGQRWLAVLAGLGLFGLLVAGIGRAIVGAPLGLAQANASGGGNVESIAELIFGRYVFAFELTSGLLITAAVGAMVLSHPERLFAKKAQPDLAADRMKAYAETGTHPGALPNSGVYARTNSITAPALLPDGSIAQDSLSPTLQTRAGLPEPEVLTGPMTQSHAAIEQAQKGEQA